METIVTVNTGDGEMTQVSSFTHVVDKRRPSEGDAALQQRRLLHTCERLFIKP